MQELAMIISKTKRPGTIKMAKLLSAAEVFAAEDYTEFERQASEITSHSKDYQAETDKQYLRYLELVEMSPAEVEPTFRQLLVVKECHEEHFNKALVLAEDLKRRFPTWDTRSVNGAIVMLKEGKTPYPK